MRFLKLQFLHYCYFLNNNVCFVLCLSLVLWRICKSDLHWIKKCSQFRPMKPCALTVSSTGPMKAPTTKSIWARTSKTSKIICTCKKQAIRCNGISKSQEFLVHDVTRNFYSIYLNRSMAAFQTYILISKLEDPWWDRTTNFQPICFHSIPKPGDYTKLIDEWCFLRILWCCHGLVFIL